MTFTTFLISVVSAVVVTVVGHFLTRRHDLLMKRELYREVLYREKVVAYREVYALAADYVHDFKYPDTAMPPSEIVKTMEQRIGAVRQAIIERGLFMPEAIWEALGDSEYVTDHYKEGNPDIYRRYDLGIDTPQEILDIFARTEECETIMDVLRDDLGVETLTADLNEFFRTASLKPRWAEWWKKVVERKPSDKKNDQEND